MEGNRFSNLEPVNLSGANNNNINKEIFGQKNVLPKENVDVKGVIFDKLILFSIFMLFFGLPIFFTGLSFQGVVFEKQIYFYFWILIGLVSWVAKGALTGEMKIKRTSLDIPILFLLAVYLISAFFSVDKWHSFWGFFGDPSRGLLSVLAVVVFYYLVLSNFNEKTLKWSLAGLIMSGSIVSIFSLLVFLGVKIVPDSLTSYVPLSLIGTITGLKIFLGMMIPIVMVTIFKLSESNRRSLNILSYVLAIFVPINLFVISMIFDKTTGYIILFGVGFFLLYILSHVVRPKDKLTWLPMLTFVLAMIMLASGGNGMAKVNAPIEVSPELKVSWEVAKGGLKEDPIFGSGPATYGFDFSKYKPKSFNENMFYGIRFYQASGLFFEAFSTLGLLGLVASLAVVIVFINIAIYLISREKEKNKIYSLGLLTASIILILSSFLFRIEGTIVLLAGIVASVTMATVFWESGLEGKYFKLSLKASPKFALTLAFIFIIVSAGVATLFVYIGKAYLADIYAGKATKEAKVTEAGSVAYLGKAINLNRREGRYYSRIGQEFIILANAESAKPEGQANQDMINNYINNAVAAANKGNELMVNDALAISVLAQIYENLAMQVTDALSFSSKSYEKLLAVEPHNPLAYLKLGQIKIIPAMQEKDEAKRMAIIKDAKKSFEEAVGEKSNFAEAHYYLAITQNALDEKDAAIESLLKAVANDKKNLTYLFNLGRAYQEKGGEADLENARQVFEYVTKNSPEEVNTIFALGMVYEKKGEKDLAVEKYQKVIEIISKLGGNSEETITRLNKMISNVKAGISNSNLNEEAIKPAENPAEKQNVDLIGPAATQNASTPSNPTTDAPVAPVNPVNPLEPTPSN
ncbi:MAG: tetratricopeptide repeat protein [Candidatus Moraniibacteriota bacterium]